MIVCSGDNYDVGDSGGSETATTDSNGVHSHSVTVNSGGSHSHTVTVNSHTLTGSQAPSHFHEASFDYCDVASGGSYGITAQGGRRPQGNKGVTVDSSGGSQSHTHTASSNSTGSHTHTASSNSTGAHTHTVSTLSPYYALAFIIKL